MSREPHSALLTVTVLHGYPPCVTYNVLLLPDRAVHSQAVVPSQAAECQKISDQLLGVLREFNLAWPERILRPVQWARSIVEASPWVVNTIAISRDLGERCRARPLRLVEQPLRQTRQDVARIRRCLRTAYISCARER